ncbi:hypothetical protein FTUN_3476 [Frigoriglobus tundricola]|uniref:Uncharacterized protein n=1 Tax=Frigoriglobus tundricola TaxID=2774151 RepID=A0A6M5YSG9_9BACT|nr:hypothetical protein FTUN_3476 [Frigoriglobus tundricola]
MVPIAGPARKVESGRPYSLPKPQTQDRNAAPESELTSHRALRMVPLLTAPPERGVRPAAVKSGFGTGTDARSQLVDPRADPRRRGGSRRLRVGRQFVDQPGPGPGAGRRHPEQTVRGRGHPRRFGPDAHSGRDRRHRPPADPPGRPHRPAVPPRPERRSVPRQRATEPRYTVHPQGGNGRPDVPRRALGGRQVEPGGGAQTQSGGPADPDVRAQERHRRSHRPGPRRAAPDHALRRPPHAAQRPAVRADRSGDREREGLRPVDRPRAAEPDQQPPGPVGRTERLPARRGRRADGGTVRPGTGHAPGPADRERERESRPQLRPGPGAAVATRRAARGERRAVRAPGTAVAGRKNRGHGAQRRRAGQSRGRVRADRTGEGAGVAGDANGRPRAPPGQGAGGRPAAAVRGQPAKARRRRDGHRAGRRPVQPAAGQTEARAAHV